MNNNILFCIENLSIKYPDNNTRAVSSISFNLYEGERIGLIGESGSGKSTVGKAMLNLLPEMTTIEGSIKFNNQSIFSLDYKQLRHLRGELVGLVFQDPMNRFNPIMTIGEHCVETLQVHNHKLSYRSAKKIAMDMLAKVKVNFCWKQYPHELSGGMRQRVAIAMVLLLKPKIIIADEPTTALDATVANEILEELVSLCKEQNMGLLMISHDLAMVGKYCNRLAVMKQGEILEIGEIPDILNYPQHHYTKSLLSIALRTQKQDDYTNIKVDKQSKVSIKPLLSIENLKQYFTIQQSFFLKKTQIIKAVDNISFDIFPGDSLGLIGESGCGKSTLSRTILQLLKATSGTINFQGQDLTQLSRKKMRFQRRHLQMIFQDPQASLNPLMTIGESIAEPLIVHGLATNKEAKEKAYEMLEKVKLNLASNYYDRYPNEISGGQQQRVAIASALIIKPSLIICDEPVSMLDVSIQEEILDLMSELKEEFKLTYLFITHDLLVARSFCNKIAVMKQGKIVEINDTNSIFTCPVHPYTVKLLKSIPLLSL